jgi:hypothetical protein
MLRCMSIAHLSRVAGRHAEAQAAVEQSLALLKQAAAEVAAEQEPAQLAPTRKGAKGDKRAPLDDRKRTRPQPPGLQPVLLIKLAREAAAAGLGKASSSSTRQTLQVLCTMLQQCVAQGRLLPHAARDARSLVAKLSRQ